MIPRAPLGVVSLLLLLAAAPAVAEAPPLSPPLAVRPAQGERSPGDAPPARVLGLAEALATARARQPALRQARALSLAAEARADESRAPLLPQIIGSGQFQRTTANVVPRPGIPSTQDRTEPANWKTLPYWIYGATASQLVYDFGLTWERWDASRAAARSQRDTETATAVQTALSVRTAFFLARAARDLVGVSRDNLANQDAHLRQIEAFVKAGTRPAIDLALARTNRANAALQLINAENAYATTKLQLNQVMGVPGPPDFEISDDTLGPIEGEDRASELLTAEALKGRPDISALDQLVRSQELVIGSVRGAYWPSLGVSTGLTYTGLAPDSAVHNWNATATLTWNFFQGGLVSAQEREARATLESARAQADALRLQVGVDVEAARLAVRAALSGTVAAGEALVNAKEQLRLAERRYETGVGSAIELGDAQVSLNSAAATNVQAEYNVSIARAQLLRALGREATTP
jgi:outer membrane protein